MLHTTSDDQLKKRRIDFVEIKFHSNKNIEWYHMQLELNWIEFQVN
jgi:hypothetical protein